MNTYFTQKSRLCTAALGVMALALLPSCQDEDFGYTAEQIKYAKNFTEKYGEIPSDKSWDLSSSANAYNPSFTRASGGLGNGSDNEDLNQGQDEHYDLKGYWEVPSQTLKWLENNLIEKKDNRWLGSNFVLKINPNSDFAIIPIYQGKSAINSSLSIKINGYNLKEICPRSKNIQAKRTAESEWEDLGYYDGWASTSFDDFKAFTNGEAGKVLHPSYTDEDYAVRAKPVYFRTSKLTNLQNDGFMYLDLINDDKKFDDVNNSSSKWDSNNTWTKIGDHLTSINPKGQMVAFNLPWDGRPETSQLPDIHEGTGENHKMPSQVLIIGCEDAHGVESDYDVNDVVYMIIGYPYAPEIVPTTQLIKKRYMCEDLGATDDFDFNDIVIDVNQSMEYKLITNPEGKAEDYEYDGNLQVYMQAKPETKKQWARISHVCGTLPFQVKVGDYYFHKVTDPTDDYKTRNELAQSATTTRGIDIAATDGWNPNETKEITGWDPKANNVKIFVEWKGGPKADNQEHTSFDFDPDSEDDRYADFANGECKVVKFPDNGTVPYIIAVDQDIPWMKERVSIPDSWVTGNLVSREGAAGPGSSAQYLDYGNDADGHTNEAVIWTGDVYGKQYSTGLDLGSDESSATFNGLKEAFSKSFNILAVYTTTPGSFGLMCNDGGWKLLTDKDADQYVVSTEQVGGLYCTKIMLTSEQLTSIRDKGLIVQNRTNGMHIQQVSMMRNNPDRNGFSVRFNIITGGQGRITTANYQRYRDDDGDSVPFEDACFANGSSVEFTATANEGYKFTGWTIAGTGVTTTSSTYNPITVSKDIIENWGINNGIVRLIANFEQLYKVHFVPQNDPGNGQYTYDLGGKCHLDITCNGNTVQDVYYASAGDVLSLTPVPCQGYEFVKWYLDYSETPRSYTVVASDTKDVPIYGVFQKKSYNITLHPDNGCIAYITKVDGVAINGKETTSGTYKYGTELTLKAEAKDGYTFVKWSNGDTNSERTFKVEADGGPYAFSERTIHSLDMSPITEEDMAGSYGREVEGGERIFITANQYLPKWTKVSSSAVGYQLSSALSQGKSLRFIMDFNGEGRGYSPHAAVLGSKAYNKDGVSTSDHAFTLMSDGKVGDNCTFENNILTFVMTKEQFDSYFMRVVNGNPTLLSDMYFGFWNFTPASIKVQVVD